jgi:hypothetical protein
MQLRLLKAFAALGIIAAVAGCGSDSTGPDNSAVVGNYTALQWTTTGTSGQTNQLSIGSEILLTLAANGTTSGHMHTAASNGAPAADFDLAGTWSASDNTVTLTQVSDNFLRDMTFAVEQVATNVYDLVGNDTFSGVAVSLRLRRAGPI